MTAKKQEGHKMPRTASGEGLLEKQPGRYIAVEPLAMVLLAALVVACDLASQARVLVNVRDGSAEITKELQDKFFELVKERGGGCYPMHEEAAGFLDFDRAKWSLFECTGIGKAGVSSELGRSDEVLFVELFLRSGGLREPREFGDFRDATAAAFSELVGPESVEVYTRTDDTYPPPVPP